MSHLAEHSRSRCTGSSAVRRTAATASGEAADGGVQPP